MYKNRQKNSSDLIAILLIRGQGRSWRVAPGPVCGANLICKRERIFEFLNKEISDSEGCLKWINPMVFSKFYKRWRVKNASISSSLI